MQLTKTIPITALASSLSDEERGGLTFIEQLTAVQVSCDNPKVPYLEKIDRKSKQVWFSRGRCGMWSCRPCALWNAKKWIARIIKGMNELPPEKWYFATVTAHRKWRKEKSLENLRKNWHKLRKRLKRLAESMDEDLYYVLVWEHHKDGSYHLHLITNVPATTRWLKDNAAACGMGYQAHIEEAINAGQAAGYTAKYMLKQSENETLHTYPKNAKRIAVSQNWTAWREKDSEGWSYAGDLDAATGRARMRKFQDFEVFDLVLRNDRKDRKNGN